MAADEEDVGGANSDSDGGIVDLGAGVGRYDNPPPRAAAASGGGGAAATSKEGQIKALKQALSDPDLFAERCKLWAALPHKRQETLRSHGALPVVISGLRKHAGHGAVVQHASRAMFELIKQEGKDCTLDFPEVVFPLVPAVRRFAGEPEAARVVLEALWLLSELCSKDSNARHAVDAGASEAVALVLRGCHAGNAAVQQVACETLANIAYHVAEEERGVRWGAMVQSGAVRAVVDTMARHARNSEVAQRGCHALACMAAGGAEEVAAAGGVAAVVAAMAAFPHHEKLQGLGCGVCANVADASPHLAHHAVVLAGGLAAVIAALKLHPESELVARDGTLAISNVAMAAATRIRSGATLAAAGMDVPGAAAVVREMLRKFQSWPQLDNNGCSALRWLAECAYAATLVGSVGATAARAAIEHSTDVIKRALRVSSAAGAATRTAAARSGAASAGGGGRCTKRATSAAARRAAGDDEAAEEPDNRDPALLASTATNCRAALEALENANAAEAARSSSNQHAPLLRLCAPPPPAVVPSPSRPILAGGLAPAAAAAPNAKRQRASGSGAPAESLAAVAARRLSAALGALPEAVGGAVGEASEEDLSQLPVAQPFSLPAPAGVPPAGAEEAAAAAAAAAAASFWRGAR